MTSGKASTKAGGSTRTPMRVLIGAIVVMLVWLAVGGVGGQSIGKLSTLQENGTLAFLPDSAESTQVAQELEKFQDRSELPMIIVATRDNGVTPKDIGQAQGLSKQLPEVAFEHDGGTVKVGDYLTNQQIPAIPSEDGKAILMVATLDAAKVEKPGSDAETPLDSLVDAVRADLSANLGAAGMTTYVTGPAGFVRDLGEAFAGIDGILLVVALVVVLVILLVVYRSPVLPFAVLATAVFGLGAAGLVVYQVADAGWVTVSGQSQGILSILVVGATTDYALLLVARYKEELQRIATPWAAMRAAWRRTLAPVAASALTVTLGLLALMLAELKGSSGLGPVAALGIAGSVLAALTFLPAVLVIGRRWIFWPAIPRYDEAKASDAGGSEVPDRQHGRRSLMSAFGWGTVVKFVRRSPRATWIVTTVALLAAAAFFPLFKSDGISQSEFFLNDVEAVTGQEQLAEHFEAGAGDPVQIIAPEGVAQDVVKRLESEQGVTDPQVGLVRGQDPKVVDGRVVVQATLAAAADSPEAGAIVDRLRDDLRQVDPSIQVGGQSAQSLDSQRAGERDLLVVIPTIVLVVFVVLCLLLRSLIAPLMLIVVNILSFFATMGIAALLFNYVFKFPGGEPTTILFGFVFLVALSVDYSIFLMTRAREEAHALGTKEGVLKALAVTGGVITSAGVVLAATFGALVVVPLLFLAQVAFIVAFGVLLDTLVVRSLLVPALTVEMGRWTWWPGPLFRRHDPEGVDDEERTAAAQA